jgi:hypothetical protein
MNKIIIKLSSLQAPERKLIRCLYPEFAAPAVPYGLAPPDAQANNLCGKRGVFFFSLYLYLFSHFSLFLLSPSLFLSLSASFFLSFFSLFLFLCLSFFLSHFFLLTFPTVEGFGSLLSCTPSLAPALSTPTPSFAPALCTPAHSLTLTLNTPLFTPDCASGTLPSSFITHLFLHFTLVTRGDQQRDSLLVPPSLSSLAVNDTQQKPRLISDKVCSNYSTSTKDKGDKSNVVDSSPDATSRAKKCLFTDNDDSTSADDKPRKHQTGKRLCKSTDRDFVRPILLDDKYDKRFYSLLLVHLLTTLSMTAVNLFPSVKPYHHDVKFSPFLLLFLGSLAHLL